MTNFVDIASVLQRSQHTGHLRLLLGEFPAVAILGARQVGKTTLARQLAAEWPQDRVTFLDLEDPTDLARLDDAKLALEPLRGLVVLDEVQRLPELFPLLRVLLDRSPSPAKFLLLGSASPDLVRTSSESLAGRIAYHHLPPLAASETGPQAWETLWERGGFPRSFLAPSSGASMRWRQSFVRTYLERDLRELGIRVTSQSIRRFWTMLAHTHGGIWNAADLGKALGVSSHASRRFLDILCGTFMARRLQPWSSNVGKREVKAPKVYLSDTGLLHFLLGLQDRDDVLAHPKAGLSFESFAMAQVVDALGAEPEECFFWSLHSGAELDLLVVRGERRLGFEFKLSSAPTTSKSMHAAVEQLGLERLDVVFAGSGVFPLREKIRAVGIASLHEAIGRLDARANR